MNAQSVANATGYTIMKDLKTEYLSNHATLCFPSDILVHIRGRPYPLKAMYLNQGATALCPPAPLSMVEGRITY